MFERYTERARQVVLLAQEEARSLKHHHIGSEHILLGLFREDEGLASRVLSSLDVELEATREQILKILGQEPEEIAGQIPFTPRAKKILELSLRESLSLGHNYIGTEHILLGLSRENEGVAARVLLESGVDGEQIRNAVIHVLSGRENAGPVEVIRSYIVLPATVIHRVKATNEFDAVKQVTEQVAKLGRTTDRCEWLVFEPKSPGRKVLSKRSNEHDLEDRGEV